MFPQLQSNLLKRPPLQDDQLCNAISDHLFVPQMKKKKLSKTATAKLYPAEKWEAMNKNKSLSDYIYFVATL